MAKRSDRPQERAVYIISVAAELAGVHPQTLRIYERKGLLTPARTAGNTRRYSERDIDRLRAIQELTRRGINLAGVKMIIELQAEVGRIRRRIEALREEIDRRDEDGRGDLIPLGSARVTWEHG
jgi:MerR family transcriptional regulator, heat shock protein HspR